MPHYAKIENGIVSKVIVADADFISSLEGTWIKTDPQTDGGIHYTKVTRQPSADQSKALRKNFASIGYTYNGGLDAFIPPKPYASWQLNTSTCRWQAPVEKPGDNYLWDETTGKWIEKDNVE